MSVTVRERPWHALHGDRPREPTLPFGDLLTTARARISAIALLAASKLGGIAVPPNSMRRELRTAEPDA